MRFQELTQKELRSLSPMRVVLLGHATHGTEWCLTVYHVPEQEEYLVFSSHWGNCCCEGGGILPLLGKSDRLDYEIRHATEALLISDATENQVKQCVQGMFKNQRVEIVWRE